MPPTIIASVADIAPGSPPDTGASRNATPCASQAAAIFCELAGAMELMSITTDPSDAPSRTPFWPRIAASESAESGTIVMTVGVAAATSAADDAGFAPSPTTSSIAVPTTSYTVSEYPAFIRLRAIGRPIIPSPIKPTSPLGILFSFLIAYRTGRDQILRPAKAVRYACR